MVKVIATSKGYFGGVIREEGASFNFPDELWNDAKRRPSWAKLDPSKAFGGKGDHDGNGSVGGSKQGAKKPGETKQPAGPVVPADWQNLKPEEIKALAEQLGGKPIKRVDLATKFVAAYVEANKPEPFSEAPAPETVKGNGVQAALGGAEPDWLPPGSDPTPVAE